LTQFLWSGEIRESRGKIRKSEKVWEFYIPKSGKNKRVRKSQGKSKYQGAKVNKDAEKVLNCFAQTVYNSSQIFFCLLHLQIISIYTLKFVPPSLFLVRLQAIESQHWYFA